MPSMTAMAALSPRDRFAEARTKGRPVVRATGGAPRRAAAGRLATAGTEAPMPAGRAGVKDSAGAENNPAGAEADVDAAAGGALVSPGTTGADATCSAPAPAFSK